MQSRGCARARSVASAPLRVDVEGDVSGGPFLGPIFKGPKKGGGLLYQISSKAASVFWREPISLARRAALRRVVYSPLRFLLFLFLSCNNNTEPFLTFVKVLQDETRKN